MKKWNVLILFLLFQLGFSQNKLTETQKLATTCKVWGFLKYYHPNVANGSKDWDKQLFDVLPEVEKAKNKEEFSIVLENWIDSLGTIKEVKSRKNKQKVDYFDKNFDLSWIRKSELFSKTLSHKLKDIEKNRIQEKQYYVNLQTDNKNAVPLEFTNEVKYLDFEWTEKNLRLLAYFRYWNYVEYFFPYKYQMDQKWDMTLNEMLPKFINPATELDFHLALIYLSVKLNDSHAAIGTNKLFERFGNKFFPAILKIIDNKAVVTEFYNDSIAKRNNIKIGDAIIKINGKNVSQIIKENLKYSEGSNLSAQLKKMALFIFNGNTDVAEIEFIRNGEISTNIVERYLYKNLKIVYEDNIPWKLLNGNIGYINLNGLELKQLTEAMEKLKETKALIFDIRNYPNDIEHDISEYLNPEEKEFVKFIDTDLSYPGRFVWRKEIEKCGKHNPNYYKGKVILLVNDESISHSEYAAMCLQTAPNATVIGSQTSGADGGVCRFEIIKGFRTQITSYGVFYPNKKETQRIGIIPDIEIKPTIKGIQEGRDEVLDRAVKFINQGK